MPSSTSHHCPICEAPNHCAMARGEGAVKCWCADVKLAPGVIDKVTAADKFKRCLCRACATATGEPPRAR